MTANRPALERILFSAPFGNYLGGDGITSTLGTFTLAHRAGALKRTWRVVKTVRYSPLLGAWVNRLGLPNPGIDAALTPEARRKLAGRLLSVHGFTLDDWLALFERVGELERSEGPVGVELNVSCPNVRDDPPAYAAIFRAACERMPFPVVVKLPPVAYERAAAEALEAGISTLHACNTLPVVRGGLSGKPLMSVSLRVVEGLRERYPEARLIGGGGITGHEDVELYRRAGADHFAVASALFFPWRIRRFRRLARKLQDDRAVAGDVI